MFSCSSKIWLKTRVRKFILRKRLLHGAFQPIASSAVIVIHPGSYYLRIGRASDAFPHTLPHCIAHRRKDASSGHSVRTHEDQSLERDEAKHAGSREQKKKGLQSAMNLIRSRPTSYGDGREAVTFSELAEANQYSSAEFSDVMSPLNWTSTLHTPQHLIGQEALYIDPSHSYNLHWPIQRGRLNLHKGVNGTLSAVIHDLECLWSMAITNYLDIPLSSIKCYRAVLLIPDIYDRQHVRELVSLLLNRLGFMAAFVVQESVCATLGAGVSSACIVDVGDQKTSVCCVEDGLSHKQTRVCLEYGGSDITRCYYELLVKAGFPYKECDLSKRMDAVFLKELKESHCHLDQDEVGSVEELIQVKLPAEMIVRYRLQMGDERILAPIAVFVPDMMGMLGSSLWRPHRKYVSDPSDYQDEDYLQQTQSKHEQAARLIAARKRENAELASQNNLELSFVDDSQLDDDDTMDQSECSTLDAAATAKLNKKADDEDDGLVENGGLLGLDQAILRSIDKCENENMKRRMLSCIVVVGGGLMFSGAQTWLQYLVSTTTPQHMQALLDTLDITTRPKDVDPRLVCWKGGAVLCCLDTAHELWICDDEWQRWGVKMLRERAPFVW